ncbi:MAG: electron transfer flavoprotein subunit beta/FixA family protein [Candidatus Nezhaarchaeota archaeon]|nr:electron transfer flavoprotein subunit beta/FixA family protein [Candidatus Nezhaarchaeota archaeon]MCX8142093.1 electron transfer flavoprotein subunit beta/FixA family protein [Candidatus Nezhaarchaeota archaeon]MDW8050126.1 electron transfer flavoprotein subunit beta/FixA family protein [Nitrososphaerota archaeon]
MDIIVCVKHVPETAEAEIKIDPSGRDIDKSNLVYSINEWDDYAVEAAVRIKEQYGGTVTAITVGPEDADSTLRRCLARGADAAIRITDPKILGSDAYVIARILYNVIKNMRFDLVFTGVQTSDDGSAVVGPVLAELLRIPHVTMVKRISFKDGRAIVNRELEGGYEEVLEVGLPALFTIQSGVVELRYVSLMAIRRAMRKEIKVLKLSDIGLTEQDVGEAASWLRVEKLFIPPAEKKVEFITGSPDQIASRIVEILRQRGLI